MDARSGVPSTLPRFCQSQHLPLKQTQEPRDCQDLGQNRAESQGDKEKEEETEEEREVGGWVWEEEEREGCREKERSISRV